MPGIFSFTGANPLKLLANPVFGDDLVVADGPWLFTTLISREIWRPVFSVSVGSHALDWTVVAFFARYGNLGAGFRNRSFRNGGFRNIILDGGCGWRRRTCWVRA